MGWIKLGLPPALSLSRFKTQPIRQPAAALASCVCGVCGAGASRCVTWVDLPVVPDPVGVHDVLEAGGELVGLDERGRRVVARYTVYKGRQRRSAFPLQ